MFLPDWVMVQNSKFTKKTSFSTFFHQVLNCVLPQNCFVCGDEAGQYPVCARCIASLPDSACQQRCLVCALPVMHAHLCGRCLKRPPWFDVTFVAFDYAFPVDMLLHTFKYHGRLALAPFFAERLAVQCQSSQIDFIVPVPLHPHRLGERGFNQALEVARPLANLTELKLEYAIVQRVKETATQADLAYKARIRNVRKAFECTHRLDHARILIVDDVMTTGATVNELARLLKRQGAAWVGNAIIARTLLSGITL